MGSIFRRRPATGTWETCTVCGIIVDTTIDSGNRDPMGGLWVCGSCMRERVARQQARHSLSHDSLPPPGKAGHGVKRRCLACGGTMSAAYVGQRCGMCGRGPMVDLEGPHANRMSGPGSDPATGGRCPACQGTSGTLETPCPRCLPPTDADEEFVRLAQAESHGKHLAVLAALQLEYNAEASARHRRITEALR